MIVVPFDMAKYQDKTQQKKKKIHIGGSTRSIWDDQRGGLRLVESLKDPLVSFRPFEPTVATHPIRMSVMGILRFAL